MKIQVASDLHLEFFERQFPGYRVIEPHPAADVLVLAGDIHRGTEAWRAFADWPVPVICIHGNHELYRLDGATVIGDYRQGVATGVVTPLECRQIVIGGVRFLGTCLWTDYALYGAPDDAMKLADRVLMDHQAILWRGGRFTPAQALALHREARAWLLEALATPFAGPTVVCTHHAPHTGSIHLDYQDNPLNPGFISDCSELLGIPALWLHGHVHNSFDYVVSGTRVVANPRGYALNRRAVAEPSALTWENPAFEPGLVIEV